MSTNSSIKNKTKAKGNAFENKIAKAIGEWMFDDKHTLCRHQTSGAQKHTYVGDIVPQKPLPNNWNNGIWPFLIECKNGYKNSVPTLNKQTIVRTWLTKAIEESTVQQNIIYLITSFHGYSPLLFTDVSFLIASDLVLNLKHKNKIIPFYVYSFNDLIEYEFKTLYGKSPIVGERLKQSREGFASANRTAKNSRAISI